MLDCRSKLSPAAAPSEGILCPGGYTVRREACSGDSSTSTLADSLTVAAKILRPLSL